MRKIKINCEGCSIKHEVNRDLEAPKDATSMGCNWCPNCEDETNEYYKEWYNRSEGGEVKDPVPGNQLCMPFELDRITESKVVKFLNGGVTSKRIPTGVCDISEKIYKKNNK